MSASSLFQSLLFPPAHKRLVNEPSSYEEDEEMATMIPLPGGLVAVDVNESKNKRRRSSYLSSNPGADGSAPLLGSLEQHHDNNDNNPRQERQSTESTDGAGVLATERLTGSEAGGIETIFTAESLKKLRAHRKANQKKQHQQYGTSNPSTSGVFRFFRQNHSHKRHAHESPAAVALWMTSDHRPERRRLKNKSSRSRSRSRSNSNERHHNKTREGMNTTRMTTTSTAFGRSTGSGYGTGPVDIDDELLNLSIQQTASDDISSLHHNPHKREQQRMLRDRDDVDDDPAAAVLQLLASSCSRPAATATTGVFSLDRLVDSMEARCATSPHWQAIENTLSCTPYAAAAAVPAIAMAESNADASKGTQTTNKT